jgi:hypothetical protein
MERISIAAAVGGECLVAAVSEGAVGRRHGGMLGDTRVGGTHEGRVDGGVGGVKR